MKQNNRYVWGAILVLSLMLGASTESTAQKRRKGKPSKKPQVSAPASAQSSTPTAPSAEQLGIATIPDSIRAHAQPLELARNYYNYYAFEDARTMLAKAEQNASADDINLLRRQIDQAERLVSNSERVHLLDTTTCTLAELPTTLAKLSPDLGKILQFALIGQKSIGEYYSPTSSTAISTRDTKDSGLDLIREERISGSIMEVAEAFGTNINSAEDESFPYLLPDGISLIFARRGTNSLGGYDLYMTRYNWERKTYLEPSHLPMPFNSPANDYLLAYDEHQGLTYLVSDRLCPAGSVRIYRIIGLPRALGATTEDSTLPELSTLEERRMAMLTHATSTRPIESTAAIRPLARSELYLPLSGGDIVRSWKDFQSSTAMEEYRRALALALQLDLKRERQATLRNAYRTTPESRNELTPELQSLETEIRQLEQTYRRHLTASKNAEIRYRSNR